MAAGNFEIQGKALVILITRLVEYRYIRIGWESWCLPYAGFLEKQFNNVKFILWIETT